MGKPACLRWTFVHPLTTSALSLLILLPLVRLVLPDVRKNAAGDQETMHRLLAVSELLQSPRLEADEGSQPVQNRHASGMSSPTACMTRSLFSSQRAILLPVFDWGGTRWRCDPPWG